MKKQFNPFPDVFSRYGSPMGRRGDNPANLQDVKRLHARHQGGADGYDKGGAYWGTPSNVWGVWAWFDGEVARAFALVSNGPCEPQNHPDCFLTSGIYDSLFSRNSV